MHPGDAAYMAAMNEWDDQFYIRLFEAGGLRTVEPDPNRPHGWTVVHALNPDGTRELVVVVKSPLPPAVETAVAAQERADRQRAMNVRRDVYARRWLTQYGPYWVSGAVERWSAT